MSEILQGRRAVTFIITGSFANLYISTILSQWHIQRDFGTVIPVWSPKLCVQIKEEISLIQILEDKISIAIVSKHCKKFNFTISLLLLLFLKKKQSKLNCFHMFQPVFTSNFELGLMYAFYTSLLILMFPNNF